MFRWFAVLLLAGAAFAQNSLTSGQNQNGAIAMPFQVESWTFSANQGDALFLSIGKLSDDNGFWPYLRLQGPNGSQIASSFGSVVAQVYLAAPATGTYTVLVSSNSGQGSGNLDRTGTYRISLARAPSTLILPDTDETGLLVNGIRQHGTLDLGDLDIWTFPANSGDRVLLSIADTLNAISNTYFAPCIRLIGPDGVPVATTFGSVVAQIDRNVTLSGTYTVLVSSNSGQGSQNLDGTGPYDLTLARVPGAAGSTLINGVRQNGNLELGALDVWKFQADTGDHVFLSIADTLNVFGNAYFSPYMRLIGPNGVVVASSFGLVVAQIDFTIPLAGTYTVIVSSDSGQGSGNIDGAGPYHLTLAKVPGATGTALHVGSGNSGTITVGDVGIWNLKANAGERIILRIDETADNGGFWPWIRLLAPSGVYAGSSFGSASAEFQTIAPVTGVYTVLVTANSGQGSGNLDATGSYDITSSHAGSSSSGAAPTANKGLGPDCPGGVYCGNPINITSGNKYEEVTDYRTATSNSLAFTRYYNSQADVNAPAGTLGRYWRSNFDRKIYLTSASSVIVERATGQSLVFGLSAGKWTPDSDIDLKLTQTGSGIGSTWTLKDADDTTETYTTTSATAALLNSVAVRNGYTQTLQRTGDLLTSVTDSFGRALQFTYNSGLVQSLTTPDGLVLSYGYTASGATPGTLDRLASVSYPTTPVTSRQYLYENASFPFALTGAIDEKGTLFASWIYDSSGRATSSQHAGGADLTTVAYNSDGTRTVTNALGQQEAYTFSTLQGLPKVIQINRLATTNTAAASRTFTYDANGYRASETDWNGNLTTYVNDARGLPTSITQASGTPVARTTTTTYHATLHLPTRVVEPGLTTDLTYDANGNLLTRTLTDTTTTTVPYSTNGVKRTWTYTWGTFGLLASIKGPRTDRNQTTSFAYDASGTLIRTTNALGQQSQVTQHTPGGLPQTVVDPNGVTTQLVYDARLRLASSTVNTVAGGLTTTYTYDAAGNRLSVTAPDGSKLTNGYDLAHRLISVTDLFNQVALYTLDPLGGRIRTDVNDSGGLLKRTRSGGFDALGRILVETAGAGQATRYAYDSNGNPLSITDPLLRVTTQAFDALNRRYRVTDPAAGITVTTFDAHNRPLTVTAPNGAVTTYVYDGFGDLIQETSPDRGKTVYRYDLAANLTQVVDARNVVQNHSYDALDRRVSTTYPAGAAENVTLSYDQAGHGFGVGRLTSVADEAGTLSRSYDEQGNLTGETRTRGASVLTTAYTYDAASRVGSIRYPSGATSVYQRDTMGRITGIAMDPSGPAAALPVVSNVTYQPFGPVAGFTFGNGVDATRTYDLDYRLTNLNDGSAQSLAYSYSPADNVSAVTDGVTPASTQSFQYDLLDRLTGATGVYGSLAYTYDSVGNRLTQAVGASTTNYVYTAQSNRLTQVKAGSATQILSYTPAGAITTIANVPSTRPATGIAYNQAGRLQRVLAGGAQTLAYLYDAFGRRLVKVAGNVTTIYQYDEGRRLLEEAGASVTDYVYFGDTPVATFTPSSGALAFVHTDRLGTPQKVTNSARVVTWRADYLPFGESNAGTSQTGGTAQSLRFPGQEFEPETGWHQNGFRDYAPGLGRYLESDPIGLAGGVNTYGYATGNPITLVDRYGLQTDPDDVSAVHSRVSVVPRIGEAIRSNAEAAIKSNPNQRVAELEDRAERGDKLAEAELVNYYNNGPRYFYNSAAHATQAAIETCKMAAVTVSSKAAEIYDAYSTWQENWRLAGKPPQSLATPQINTAARSNAGCGDYTCSFTFTSGAAK